MWWLTSHYVTHCGDDTSQKYVSPLVMIMFLKTWTDISTHVSSSQDSVTPCHEETSQDTVSLSQDSLTPHQEQTSHYTVSLSQDSVTPHHEQTYQDIVSLSQDSVTPRHEQKYQDSVTLATNRHIKTVSLSQDSVTPRQEDISRHCVIISRQCHPSPGTDILRHCATHVIRQCKYSTSKIPINAYFHPGS